MARRVVRGKTSVPAGTSSPETPDDLAVLSPDKTVEIAGETITVRELRFGEQLHHGKLLAAVVEAMRPFTLPESSEVELLVAALDSCGYELAELMAVATNKPVDWILSLSGDDGEALTARFWETNKYFFLRRLLVYPAPGRTQQALAGDMYSPPLSSMDTTRNG